MTIGEKIRERAQGVAITGLQIGLQMNCILNFLKLQKFVYQR